MTLGQKNEMGLFYNAPEPKWDVGCQKPVLNSGCDWSVALFTIE